MVGWSFKLCFFKGCWLENLKISLENQPQTFIFWVPCYIYIYRFWRVYVYVRTTEETSEQHICWGDAEIEGFQLLDGKIQNVKQKHNICYMDIYDIIYMYIYIQRIQTPMFGWSFCYKLQMILRSMWPRPSKMIPKSETFLQNLPFTFPYLSFVTGPFPHLNASSLPCVPSRCFRSVSSFCHQRPWPLLPRTRGGVGNRDKQLHWDFGRKAIAKKR